ncbi:acetoacetyl-CoA synthetase [Halopolyspora algeriensis]|uniref:Acetoacetyl-CoA synthetase n=1 Tax=Halopolyspora algeriensis TaxID=1500506 RepID=A0A368VB57_9ACTN|nr:acetoacetate--CoA ligase [Halopolyspora algeriensis]RCW38487.1 acetoacetyl-CoA synthetase [Halopolyspora algeriensis]TQM42631.1 acetoacetyl-CoA synthetase [Halopolyspora algeriensis]
MTSSTHPDSTPELLWQPSPERVEASRMARFRGWLRAQRGLDLPDYQALWRWSVSDLEGFWGALAEFFDVDFHDRPHRVLTEEVMPGAEWFPGATVNYAEHALRNGPGKSDADLAVVFAREDGAGEEITFGELRARVAAARAGLIELGVRRGDRVAALAPNSPETLVAFLAAASLGATWSSCSPDFGLRAVADRFVQIEPTVLIAVDGYVYGGRSFDVRSTIDELRGQLPGLGATVLIDYLGNGASLPGATGWAELLDRHRGAELAFDAVPFDHPLWVLYSSGTTGLPKGIVHGHGGMTLEHLKAIGLHCDLGPGDRFFWFTTTGWMMWNFLVGGLLAGATVVLYDGSPAHPSMTVLWELTERYRVNYFGTSAPYIQGCLKQGLRPKENHDLSALRAVGSTGAPLTSDGFHWVADAVGSDVQIASVSGGTDLCTAFVGASPDVPVWMGEISCRLLGAAVAAYDERGSELHGDVGELVITKPMPTMPVFFWNDPDGSRLREAYFDTFPGIWRHGDWVKITERDTLVIYGRSDSTLNRGGIRMGTAEFYRVVEGFDAVLDSLVIDTSGAGETDGELLCFLVLAEGTELDEIQPDLAAQLRSQLSPRHVPNRFIVVDEVPHTLNGKKLEVPVKKILAGTAPERAVSRDALQNPESLAPFVQFSAG